MNKYLLILLLITQFVSAQITLDHTFTDHKSHSVRFSKIDNTNVVYYMLDDLTDTIKVYDLDNTLIKTIVIPSIVRNGRSYIRVVHLTKYLFDSDNEYEFVISFNNPGGSTHYFSCYVLNEDGTVLLDGSDFRVSSTTNESGGLNSEGLVKTASGDLKLLLSNFNPDSSINETRVYNLPGIDYNLSKGEEVKLLKMGVSPNPTINNKNTVYHDNLNDGKIIIYNKLGQLIKQIMVVEGSLETEIDLSKFSIGMYYYQLYDGGNKIGVKKVINK